MKTSFQPSRISTLALAMACLGGPALAQDAAPAEAQAAAAGNAEPVNGEDIVVTAAAGDKSRFRSSISVSQVSQEAIQNFTPRSTAEILRNIPGLQPSDTAGPGGNANIGVRGIPVSTGGSEYVSLQEDGLPDVLFGDINFGNNDYWLRFDQNVERVEAVRGGSASTFASQAPGAVVNYISKTGEKEGGSIGLSKGVGFRETRVDFDYGGPISDTLGVRIAAQFNDIDEFQLLQENTPAVNQKRGLTDLIVRGTLDWQPSDMFRANLKVQYTKNENDGAIGTAEIGCGANGVADSISLLGGGLGLQKHQFISHIRVHPLGDTQGCP